MKKKLVKLAIVAALLVGATAPASAVSLCDVSAFSFDVWFYQQFYC